MSAVSVLGMPEEGELVLATVNQINPHGAYVSLDEYGGVSGFLHISEISTGWVKNIERFVKLRQKVVLKVIRVNRTRREVDLSLRQVSNDERRAKLIEVKKADKARGILELTKSRLSLTKEEEERCGGILVEAFGSLYSALEEVARRGREALANLNLPEEYVTTLEGITKEKITIPSVEIRGVAEVSCKRPDGIDVIKAALSAAEDMKYPGAEVKVSYLGTSKYRILVKALNYKLAEKSLEKAVSEVRRMIEKADGTFSFSREDSKKVVR